MVDPPVLSPEMDSSVEKVSSDPRSPRSICVPDAGLVRVFINRAVCFILLPTQQGSGALDPDEGPPASGEAKACTECHTTKTPLWRGGPCGPMVSRVFPIPTPRSRSPEP